MGSVSSCSVSDLSLSLLRLSGTEDVSGVVHKDHTLAEGLQTGEFLQCLVQLVRHASPVSYQEHAQAILALLLRADGLWLRGKEDCPCRLHFPHKVCDRS